MLHLHSRIKRKLKREKSRWHPYQLRTPVLADASFHPAKSVKQVPDGRDQVVTADLIIVKFSSLRYVLQNHFDWIGGARTGSLYRFYGTLCQIFKHHFVALDVFRTLVTSNRRWSVLFCSNAGVPEVRRTIVIIAHLKPITFLH